MMNASSPQNWPRAPQLSRLHTSSSSNSQSDEKNKRSKRRRRKQGGASSPSSPSALPSPASYDASLEELIVDERKSALPRLEDLKMLKSGKAVGPDTGSTGGKPGILMPRELEEMKQKEKAKQPTKGAPAYFDTMTKVTWTAIALLILAEVVAQVIPKASTVTPGG
ncbi:hypothetical protein NSK_004623 [Nannochloropsis salina CCMP1776]|uniref:Uncharacterized protein n=1 Tax=Nannochloropsis salina CCMP1776 TaxID=1027361 RepID=A0A4D9CXN6_9STRA|nr:hypothetical protein NSK_004623 [Nannochloropsis salina CCMP1776]|eukprot:TFJ84151.1 hypothetical protein NSK_004623 [Nannochloropsis salina CCMP1776]